MAKKEKEAPQTEDELINENEAVENKNSEEENETEKLQKELDAAKEAHMRTLAEYDNFRKRSIKEKEAIAGDSKAMALTELLPVLDNFERAAMNAEADFDSYRKGVEMTFGSFMEVLRKLGVEQFGEPGEQFDPNIHNAVMHCEDESLEENVITDVFSKGYKLGDRVLRHAMVKVAN
ncbi:MAG: nucleotide exchange factor GrpE [Ruminococcaceae bacterium]|nr:nucleotide exchange factor GrpE [Oscillospiraceae bacterium]MBQ6872937.1 nucleotide exchange factor GrpE [Clostridia bacterium]